MRLFICLIMLGIGSGLAAATGKGAISTFEAPAVPFSSSANHAAGYYYAAPLKRFHLTGELIPEPASVASDFARVRPSNTRYNYPSGTPLHNPEGVKNSADASNQLGGREQSPLAPLDSRDTAQEGTLFDAQGHRVSSNFVPRLPEEGGHEQPKVPDCGQVPVRQSPLSMRQRGTQSDADYTYSAANWRPIDTNPRDNFPLAPMHTKVDNRHNGQRSPSAEKPAQDEALRNFDHQRGYNYDQPQVGIDGESRRNLNSSKTSPNTDFNTKEMGKSSFNPSHRSPPSFNAAQSPGLLLRPNVATREQQKQQLVNLIGRGTIQGYAYQHQQDLIPYLRYILAAPVNAPPLRKPIDVQFDASGEQFVHDTQQQHNARAIPAQSPVSYAIQSSTRLRPSVALPESILGSAGNEFQAMRQHVPVSVPVPTAADLLRAQLRLLLSSTAREYFPVPPEYYYSGEQRADILNAKAETQFPTPFQQALGQPHATYGTPRRVIEPPVNTYLPPADNVPAVFHSLQR